MPEPRRTHHLISIIETLYAAEASDERWLARLLPQLATVLDFGFGVALSVIHQRDDKRSLEMVGGHGELDGPYLRLQQAGIALEPEPFDAIYRPAKAIVRASRMENLPAEQRAVLAGSMGSIGASDAIWLWGSPSPEFLFQVAAPASADAQVSRRHYEWLHLLRIHLDAAIRLRLQRDRAWVQAVLAPDGTTLHREGEMDDASTAELARRAVSVERARLRTGRSQRDAAGQWKALVEGRWSLVERTESDGRRVYLAYENPPAVRTHRQLSVLECRALEMLGRGLTAKHIAYELGTSASVISEGLSRAMLKLGVSNKADLLKLAASLTQQPLHRGQSVHAFTDTEQEILELLARGLSNAQIAEKRGTSVNTVANQVSAMLAKSGCASRLQLAVHARIQPRKITDG